MSDKFPNNDKIIKDKTILCQYRLPIGPIFSEGAIPQRPKPKTAQSTALTLNPNPNDWAVLGLGRYGLIPLVRPQQLSKLQIRIAGSRKVAERSVYDSRKRSLELLFVL